MALARCRTAHVVVIVVVNAVLLQTKRSSGFAPTATTRIAGFRHPRRIKATLRSNRARDVVEDVGVESDEPCLVGDNIVASCNTIDLSITKEAQTTTFSRGTQTKLSAALNLGKCICGAGSFALPHVFLSEGVIGGTLAMMVCAFLAMTTMQSINKSRFLVVEDEPALAPPTSYVELTRLALGDTASKVVFTLTLFASLGVCSTYIVFVGQTLASLSADAMSGNIVHTLAPNIDETTWEMITAITVFPLSLVRNYGVFAFTSALGVSAVLGGILVTLAYGVLVDPGGGILEALSAVSQLKMWPDSFSDAFGGSFGTIAYLFCINFLTFPIINSMRDARNDYDGAISSAVAVIWTVNALFAVICLGFYGEETQDLILQNLGNGPYLSALKILLSIDLLFTFPVVFSSGRQILENIMISQENEGGESMSLALSRTAVTGGAVATCFCLSQVGGFGVVANLVGGVAQGTLAFIIPPAIAVALSRRRSNGKFDATEIYQWMTGAFGLAVVSSVTYFTLAESLS